MMMRLCGWKTRSMLDRYNIIGGADLSRAVEKRFTSGTLAVDSRGSHACFR
jgi:hypothetical protein